MLQNTSALLRDLSHLAVVVQAPRPDSDQISHLEFVRLREGRMLAVLAGGSGQVQNKLIEVDFDFDGRHLEAVNNYLNSLVKGLTLGEIRARVAQELEDERVRQDTLRAQALKLARAAVPETEAAGTVLVDGQSNLVGASGDVEGTKMVLRTLEEKDTLLRLLDRTLGAPGICVFIGAEANLSDLTDVSVVARPYGDGERALGTIGVIGPARMNYSKMIPLVDFTAEVITDALPKL